MGLPIPPDRQGVVPHLVCSDCEKALQFYEKAFGAEILCRMPEPGGKRLLHAEMKLNGAVVMLADEFPEYCEGASQSPRQLGGTCVGLHRYVDDCDAAMERAVSAGATVLMPAADMFWGDRYGVITDPFGHQWSFATRISEPTPQEMQAAMQAAFQQQG